MRESTVYVSGIWNSYRKCRLALLSFIYTCSKSLQDDDVEGEDSPFSPGELLKKAEDLAESIAASIPFHLARNPEVFLVRQQQLTNSTDTKRASIIPNKSLGGLRILHPLHVVSTLEIVPVRLREMFRENLAWIGKVMGIGQAGVLADVSVSF